MTPADRITAEADARVSRWPVLVGDDLIRPLASGGAIASINGVDRWFPDRRAAVAELEAVHKS